MIIHVNAQRLDWPKQTITEAQLRLYADADDLNDIWQLNDMGGATLITGLANIYDGARFVSTPKKQAA